MNYRTQKRTILYIDKLLQKIILFILRKTESGNHFIECDIC